MRIIGGEWRGRKIEEPRGRDVTRPTTDRVRESCASMVMSAFDFDLDEVRVLDAFGGSGALGLEMLSRGARSLTTFEIDRNAARLITKNIESLCRDRARWRVVTGDMLASASRGRVPGGPFDLVLLDPPYAFGAEPVEEMLQNLAQQGLLAPGAYALFEHASADAGAHPAGFETVREKRYGITSVDLLRWVGDDDGEDDSAVTDADNNDATTFQEAPMNDTINRVIVPGTFDPITFGHIDVIRRARRIFPSVIVAVAESQGKNGVGTTFTLDERVALAREALGDIDGVEVLPFTGLLVDFAREQGAGAVVKGLRAMTDFEYELQQADLNYRLDDELESIFVMSAPQYGYISSSVVRQIASLGSDVSTFVPPNVVEALKHRFS